MPRRLAASAVASTFLLGLLTVGPASTGMAASPTIEDDIVIDSADGTPIVATLMLPGGASRTDRVPAVIGTHGWAGSRSTEPSGLAAVLLERGYAILTWDSRGFGESGGEANVGAPRFEVEDARALLSYLAGRPEIMRDGPGDPRVGWIGGSNAGGVQLNTAAFDRRVDAIVPEISWGNLIRDLLPGGVPKQTWDLALYASGKATGTLLGLQSPAGPQTGSYAFQIDQAFAEATATGTISEPIRQWFSERSTTRWSGRIRTPTLILQGTIDTLFPLEDGFANFRRIRRAGTPVKLIAYCSGHSLTGCPYPGGDSGDPGGEGGGRSLPDRRIIRWIDRWVKGRDVRTGPAFEWQAQDGRYRGAPSWPLPGTRRVAGAPLRTGPLVGPGPGGGDGPADGNPAPASELGVTAARRFVLGPFARIRDVVGIPRVRLRGAVTGLQGYVFLELIDVAPDGTRVTLDDQVRPVALPGGEVDRRAALHGVSWRLRPGHRLELELTTGSAQYSIPRTGPFSVDLVARVSIPVTR
jgi:ABC-2 type transport system ATP-binding protein